jgi:hypothetical protein
MAWPADGREDPMADLPEDLRDFIIAMIDSIAHLEGLLLLMENREQVWSEQTVARRLYIPDNQAAQILTSLAEAGFLRTEAGGFRFFCQTRQLEDMVLRLAQAYRQRLITVTNLVHSKPSRLHQFANAFRMRKDG